MGQDKLVCPLCQLALPADFSAHSCPYCGFPLGTFPRESENVAESLSALQSAFIEVKKQLAALPADTGPFINLLIEHNRLTCDNLLARENHFKYLPFKQPSPAWEEILDLIAGGCECGAKEYTSAMIFKVPPSWGKSATAIYLTTYLTNIYAEQKKYLKSAALETTKVTSAAGTDGASSEKTICWPKSLPLLLTADHLANGPQITTLMARIFGFQDGYFTSPEALVTWITSTLLHSLDYTVFTLILDDPYPVSSPAWLELEQLIKAAGHTKFFKIVLFSRDLPENFAASSQKYLHHALYKPIGFNEPKKPLFLTLPNIALLSLTAAIEELEAGLGQLGIRPLPVSWSLALPAPWALSYYHWLRRTFPQKALPLLTNLFTLISALPALLKDEDQTAYEALETILSSLAPIDALNTAAPVVIEDSIEAQKLGTLGLLNRCGSGWRFFIAPIPEILLYTRGKYPKESKWLLYQLLAAAQQEQVNNQTPIKEIPELASYLQNNPQGLMQAFIELAAEIVFLGSGQSSIIYLLTTLANSCGPDLATDSAAFCYNLANHFCALAQPDIAYFCYKTAASSGQKIAPPLNNQIGVWQFLALSAACRLDLERGNSERADLHLAMARESYEHLTPDEKLLSAVKNGYLHLMRSAFGLAVRHSNQMLPVASTILELSQDGAITPFLKIEAIITSAIAFEYENHNNLAIDAWQQLENFLTNERATNLNTKLYLLWAQSARYRLQILENLAPQNETTSAQSLIERFKQLELDLAPFDYRLLPLAMEMALVATLAANNSLAPINQRFIERLLAEVSMQMVPGSATIPEAIGENSLGLMMKNSGQNTIARLFCLNALALYKHHLFKMPKTPIHIKNFSVFYYNLGVLYSAMGAFALSGTTYAHSLKWRILLNKTSITSKNEAEYKRDLALGYNVVGVLSFNCGFFKEAEDFYEEAITILESIAKGPKEQIMANDLATIYQNMAVTNQESEKTQEAVSAYFAALQWLNKGREKGEKQDEARHRIAIALNTCGLRIHTKGQSREGLLACQLALELAKELTAKYPNKLLYLTTNCGILCASAAILRQLGKNEAAKKQEEDALALLQSKIKEYPEAKELRYSLANIYLTMSRTSLHRYGPLSPKELCAKAEQILAFLLIEDPENEHYLQTLADCKQMARSYGAKSSG